MRILIFAWRDIKNPLAGGAEICKYEVGKRWVEWGHEVTIFTTRFNESSREEEIDGIKIIREGNPLTVKLHAWRHYRKYLRGRYDVVIEEANGWIPWYCSYYVDEPTIALKHQTGRNFDEFNPKCSVAHYELPPIINFGVYVLEPYLLKYFNGMPILAMSESTKKDFLDLHHSPENIYVVPQGINVKPIDKIGEKERDPTFIYLGRLKKAKRIEHILKVISIIKTQYPNVQLWIVGSGTASYIAHLKRLARGLNISDNTTFFGYLGEEMKNSLLQKAHALIITSIREGWGLVVTEANAMGTPAIGYDVAGLRDSIINGKTGILVKSGDVEALGKAIINFMEDKDVQSTITKNALEWSKEFSWERSAKVCLERINDILARVYS